MLGGARAAHGGESRCDARPVIGSPYGARRATEYRSVYRYASRLARAGAATLPPRGGARDAVAGPRKRVADGRNVITYVTTPSRLHRSTQEQITSPELCRTSAERDGRGSAKAHLRRGTEITQSASHRVQPKLHSRQPGPSASHPQSSPHSMIRTHVIQQTRSSCGSGALPASPPVKPPTARRPGRREPASRQRGRRARRMRVAALAWSHAWAPPTLRLTSSCRRPATRPLACRSFGQRSRDG